MSAFKPIAVSVRNAAKLIGVRPYHITKACRAGDLVPRKCGVKSLIAVADLERWFASLPPTPSSKGVSHVQSKS
jgi:hypothetical protein